MGIGGLKKPGGTGEVVGPIVGVGEGTAGLGNSGAFTGLVSGFGN
jgi:hypothetical protein